MLAVAALRTSARASEPRYVGPAACAAKTCHGSVVPRLESATSLQNEYVTWSKNDRHAQAYANLLTERGLRIARLLGMVDAAATPDDWIDRAARPERCLGCHAPAARADGVGCEACHGPAAAWLAPHTEIGWARAQSIALGMRDTADPEIAAETCLGCHYGDETRRVDHEMLAAGHPPLVFELDTFTTRMPVHWKETPDNGRWYRGGAWAAGQGVALRSAMRRLAADVRDRRPPDFTVYECFACHHGIRLPSWRQARGYPDRRPGDPPLDPSRHALFQLIAATVDPAAASPLAHDVRQIAEHVSAGDGSGAPSAERELVTRTETILMKSRAPLDDETLAALTRAIADAAEPLAYRGFRTAQQTAWALDAIAVARLTLAGRPDREEDPLRQAVAPLFAQLRDPAAYDPAAFARAVRALRAPAS